MILSILIPSTFDRRTVLISLLINIYNQIARNNADEIVEVLIEEDDREIPTGTKRNTLVLKSKGKYIVFVDSDDFIVEDYVALILKAAESDCDAIGISGWMTTNGHSRVDWFISKDHPYTAAVDRKGNVIYLRYNNHISPIKREIACQFKFPDIYQGEDYQWATEIHNSGLIKTETIIEKPIYHYDFRTNK